MKLWGGESRGVGGVKGWKDVDGVGSAARQSAVYLCERQRSPSKVLVKHFP